MSAGEHPDGDAKPAGDMAGEEFRNHARDLVDWIGDYLDGVGEYPVLAQVSPGDIHAQLPGQAPTRAEPMEDILRDFQEIILPGITHWNHPSFHAYFAVTGSGPGIMGEMLTAALNVNAMVWRASPAATELEEHTLGWLRQMLGLPDRFEGVINDTASSSSLYALAAAREEKIPEAREAGLFGAPPARIYASSEAHSSIDKAAITLGFGRDGITKIETDEKFRLRPDLLREAILRDVDQGIRPVAIVATLGTTSSTSMDPVAEIADIAEEFGAWLHVDSAYAGAAAILDEVRPLFAGWERADSIVMNPHKWLFTPVDCSVLYCSKPESLRAAFSVTPEYLRTEEMAVARNLMDYGISLGRRFRALKLWFVMRYFGSEGLKRRIREHIRMAAGFAARVESSPEWELAAPVPFSTVAFRFTPQGGGAVEADEMNMEILQRVNESGVAFLSHARLGGSIALRLSIGNLRTRPEHLERTWAALVSAAAEVVEVGVPG